MYQTCEYIISAVSKEQFPNHQMLPEFVFMGRSNVGKSSFINALANRKMLAYVSSKPGKTIAINFYLIDKKRYFVDVPGYGYASGKERDGKFGTYIENYLRDNQNLKVAFLLVDSKIGPTKDDLLMYDFLAYYHINTVIIATKCDRLGKTLIPRHQKLITSKVTAPVIMTSSETKYGIDKVLEIINKYDN